MLTVVGRTIVADTKTYTWRRRRCATRARYVERGGAHDARRGGFACALSSVSGCGYVLAVVVQWRAAGLYSASRTARLNNEARNILQLDLHPYPAHPAPQTPSFPRQSRYRTPVPLLPSRGRHNPTTRYPRGENRGKEMKGAKGV